MKESFFQVNAPNVVFEIFDDEVVLINMESGTYYSISNTASWIWKQIGDGCKLSDVLAGAINTFEGNHEEIEKAVSDFLEVLHGEDLIKYVEKGDAKEMPQTNPGDAPKLSFTIPVIERYTDMQDLLLLDPIHEVDETGWPTPLPENPEINE